MKLFIPVSIINDAYRNGKQRTISVRFPKRNTERVLCQMHWAADLEPVGKRNADIGTVTVTVGKVRVISMLDEWMMIFPAEFDGVISGDLSIGVERRTLLDAQYALRAAVDNLRRP